jgi:hypothetical protein
MLYEAEKAVTGLVSVLKIIKSSDLYIWLCYVLRLWHKSLFGSISKNPNLFDDMLAFFTSQHSLTLPLGF